MKKLLCFALILIFSVSFCSFAEADSTKLDINTNIISDDLTAIISIKANQGFSAFNINVLYDKDALTPISITECALIKGMGDTITSNINGKTYTADFVSAVWVSLNEIRDDGDLFEIKFKVNKSFSENTTFLKVICKELITNDKATVTINPAEVSIDIAQLSNNTSNPKPVISQKKDADKIKYMNDYGEEFKPLSYATRYEIIDALYNLFDFRNVNYATNFSDVSDEYGKKISSFLSVGVVSGYPDGTFKGENSITRAEFVKLLTTAFDFESENSTQNFFNDIEDSWARKYINDFAQKGYAKGYENSDGTYSFRPDAFVTRSECVAFINRIIGASGDLSNKKYSDLTKDFWGYTEIMKVVK